MPRPPGFPIWACAWQRLTRHLPSPLTPYIGYADPFCQCKGRALAAPPRPPVELAELSAHHCLFKAPDPRNICWPIRSSTAVNRDPRSSPNRIPWPPIILGASAAVALTLERLAPEVIPVPLAGFGIGPALGWGLIAVGAGLDMWSIMTLLRRGTNVLPNRAAEKLVTSGPFSISRNPIYLGNTILLVGAALAFRLGWFLPCALASAALVHVAAIRREEAHLAAKFGAAWDAYADRTSRWIWPI